MKAYNIINKLIQKYSYKTYLEIGVRHFGTFNSIKIPKEHKECIDPNYGNVTWKLTSDKAFKVIPETKKWDIIFIDGLHEANQVLRDIENSLKHLNENGSIVCHDMLPSSADMLSLSKCGNGWEAFAKLRMSNKNLQMYTINTDYGCAIIKKGKQELYVDDNFNHDFSEYESNKKIIGNKFKVDFNKRLMNVISCDEFNKLLKDEK